MRYKFILAVALITNFFFTAPITAVDRFWNNAAGGDYSIPSNWTPNAIPTSSDQIVFNLGGSYTVNSSAAHIPLTAGQVTVRNDDVTFATFAPSGPTTI